MQVPAPSVYPLKYTHSWILIGWAIKNTITDFCELKKRERQNENSTKYAFLKQITFFFKAKNYLVGIHPSDGLFFIFFKSACLHAHTAA